MDKETALVIITKVLSGEARPEDKQDLLVWLGEHPEHMELVRQSESIWHALEIISQKDHYNSGEAFKKFRTMAGQSRKEKNKSLKLTIDKVIRIAAVIAIIASISYIVFTPAAKETVSVNGIYTVIAPIGSKAQVILPDGTKVWLNAGSKIDYQLNNALNIREVNLEGEGYFEVAKDINRPFIVNTSDMKIRALGTKFNVKAYKSDQIVVATLIEGKVKIERKNQKKKSAESLILEPKQQASIYKEAAETPNRQSGVNVRDSIIRPLPGNTTMNSIVLEEKVNTDITTAWKSNYLYFENETFANLAIKLERRFGVNIKFGNDKIANYRFTGKFEDVIIEQVLEALHYASPFEYSIQDKTILITAPKNH
jgi:transmembrane sensor